MDNFNGTGPVEVKIVDFRDEAQRGDAATLVLHPSFDDSEPVITSDQFAIYARAGDVLIIRIAQPGEILSE